jgi:hypothetical protein
LNAYYESDYASYCEWQRILYADSWRLREGVLPLLMLIQSIAVRQCRVVFRGFVLSLWRVALLIALIPLSTWFAEVVGKQYRLTLRARPGRCIPGNLDKRYPPSNGAIVSCIRPRCAFRPAACGVSTPLSAPVTRLFRQSTLTGTLRFRHHARGCALRDAGTLSQRVSAFINTFGGR